MITNLLIFCIIQYVSSQMFHEMISAEERAELFPSGTIPEYEIVPIHHSRIQKRDNRGKNIYFEALNKKIDLWLNPLDGILASSNTPVFTVEEDSEFAVLLNLMAKIIDKIYENSNQQATVALKQMPNGNLQINGIIGAHDISIRPLPDKFIYSGGRKRRSLKNFLTQGTGNVSYHIVQKLSEQPEYLKNFTISTQTLSRSKRDAINTIYPEILVLLDYSIYKMAGDNDYDAVAYVLAFFNGVDLKYRSIENPKIRLNIAGIVLAIEPKALEYLNHHPMRAPKQVIIDNALRDKFRWLNNLEKDITFEDVNIDVAITLTSAVFCEFKRTTCVTGPIGVAPLGGACLNEQRGSTVYKSHSAIVHDTCSFEGISTTAHELGHLFGINHDGDNYNFKCNSNAGHIMTPTVILTNNGSEWSSCSLEELKNFLRTDLASCLTNKPKSGRKMPRFLPGRIEDADEQCQKMFGTMALKIDETICTQLFCIDPKFSDLEISHGGAADGTPCDVEKICLHEQCINVSMMKNYN